MERKKYIQKITTTKHKSTHFKERKRKHRMEKRANQTKKKTKTKHKSIYFYVRKYHNEIVIGKEEKQT